MGTITWLHLSDFHFKEPDEAKPDAWNADIVTRSLLEDVKERCAAGLRPDFVALTGDIAFSGKRSEYEQAGDFLDRLLEVTGLAKDRIFPVPGNHDVDRAVAGTPLAAKAASVLVDRDTVYRFLANEPERDLILKRQQNYGEFINSYFAGDLRFSGREFYFVKTIEIAGVSITLLGLNSAFLAASDADRHNLLLSERQVRNALEKSSDDGLRLALMHHPFDWLMDFDRDDVEPLLARECDFILQGHQHKAAILDGRTPDERAFTINAGAAYENRDYPNTYNYVRLDPSSASGIVYLRRYSDERGGFWAKDTLTYRNAPDGQYDFQYGQQPGSGATPTIPAVGQSEVDPDQAAGHPCVYLSRLPEGSREFVGREKELDRLNAAYSDRITTVLTVHAMGGAGKSALTSRWLDNLQKQNYPGLSCAYGWSFYSQGSGEDRQTSSDLFIAHALEWFGDPAPDAGSPRDKGERLVKLIRKQKTLLILDGLEPLQHPSGHPRANGLKDPALQVLLKGLVRDNPGLCLISSRQPVLELEAQDPEISPRIELERLSDEDGALLLQKLGAKGRRPELEAAAHEYEGHALALTLLGTYISRAYEGDIRKRDKLPELTDSKIPGGDHAARVLEAYAEMFTGRPELDLLHILGLFNRPADSAAVAELKKEPEIPGLNDRLIGMDEADWNQAISVLREARLLLSSSSTGDLECHPLVREYFGRRLREQNREAHRRGHDRLYEFYKEQALPFPETLKEMQPLFAAVAHGCAAGRFQEVLDEVFFARIRRENEHFSVNKLGAWGDDLAALAGFFQKVWGEPVNELTPTDRSFVLNEAGMGLRAVNRFSEALGPMEAALDSCIDLNDWKNASRAAQSLSEMLLTLGEIDGALKSGQRALELAGRMQGKIERKPERQSSRVKQAEAYFHAGKIDEAVQEFRIAENLRKELQMHPYLISTPGFSYCRLFLHQGDYEEVLRRAAHAIEVVKKHNHLLSIALDRLSLGRAHLQKVQMGNDDFTQASEHLDAAVERLGAAGLINHMPRGLIGRAELYRCTGDYSLAEDDLTEALEIAESGELRLLLVDAHLEYARLRLKRSVGDDREQARKLLDEAEATVNETGYELRRAELNELRAELG